MGEFFNSFKDSVSKAAEETMNHVIDKGLISLGTNTQKFAMIAIAIGALLWICKNTKVFRWRCISYVLGLLIELIELSMIK